ncbi:MAG TPA: efflux RND transporter periplasmic adaptor subunit [Bacteroidota bacterium]|nr:efflux RND transporter periplasmic adaptor subunit [Bacteroidota bacterium]
MTTLLRSSLTALFFALGLLLPAAPGCGGKVDQSGPAMTTDIPVGVTLAKREKLESSLSLVGTINASADVNAVSETQGVVRAVFVKVGMNVRAGTVLVRVDDDIPRSTRAAAEINFQKAQRDFQRSEELYQENSISASQLDASRLAMKAAENQLDIASRQLENTSIKSPIAGTVNARYVEMGTMVQPGKQIANIVDINTLKVRVNVAEREAFQLRTGDRVDVATDVYPGTVFAGTIDNIAAKADDAHTYPVEILIANVAAHPLKAGLFARITFRSVVPVETTTIPREALTGSIKEARVYCVRNGRACLTPVVIGRQSANRFEVTAGLATGDTVVTSGQNNLVDGARVQVVGQGQ